MDNIICGEYFSNPKLYVIYNLNKIIAYLLCLLLLINVIGLGICNNY